MTDTMVDPLHVVHEMGPVFAERAARHDDEDRFVSENYADLRARGFFSAAVPSELGGGGASHREMCDALRILAHYCPSTALAVAMHQHLVATLIFKHRAGQPGRQVLEAVAGKALVLVSTGANDWLGSNGQMTKVDSGYRVSAHKPFASGSPAGDVLVTSARYDDPAEGARVLHFSVPLRADGVHVKDDWEAMGMRGTGSHTVLLDDVFVPEDSVNLRRPRGDYHAFFNVVLVAALPLIMSVYRGIAETAAERARDACAGKDDASLCYAIGQMENALTQAALAHDSMVAITNDLEFQPCLKTTSAMLMRKTLVANAAQDVVEKAMEAVGGRSYLRKTGLERLLRDVHAASFHPLSESKQLGFTGRVSLGLEPTGADG